MNDKAIEAFVLLSELNGLLRDNNTISHIKELCVKNPLVREKLQIISKAINEIIQVVNPQNASNALTNNERELIQQKIDALDNQIQTISEVVALLLESTRKGLKEISDIAWDRQSKKESSSMYKVLQQEKSHTSVKSNVGDILVDTEFMLKQIQKHLDNPNLRGMVTTQEMLSFPKVAKNVKAKINEKHKNFTWKVKADDNSVVVYGSREYKINEKNTNRLLTNHSKTKAGERNMAEVNGRGLPHYSIFNDFNFRTSTNEDIIPQNKVSLENADSLENEVSTESKKSQIKPKPKVRRR